MALRFNFKKSGILRLLLLWLLLVPAAACGPSQLPEPPALLVGTWRTEAPGYDRSYLTIEPEVLVIGMEPFALSRHDIHRVEHTVDSRGHDRYELHYTADEGYDDSIEITVESLNPPIITMKHPAHPWRRDA